MSFTSGRALATSESLDESFDATGHQTIGKRSRTALPGRVGMPEDRDALDVTGHDVCQRRHETGRSCGPYAQADRPPDGKSVLDPLGDRKAKQVIYRRQHNRPGAGRADDDFVRLYVGLSSAVALEQCEVDTGAIGRFAEDVRLNLWCHGEGGDHGRMPVLPRRQKSERGWQ